MIMDIVNINVKDLLIGTAVRTFSSQKKEEMISFWVVCWMIWGWEFVGEHHRRQDLISALGCRMDAMCSMVNHGSAKMLLLRRTGIISLFRNRHWMQKP